MANDWVIATYYDNTQTTIDGGIVTAGTVQLANGNSQSIVAGITGGETEAANTSEERKVRIWAGTSKENRFTAPFRVMQNGELHATKAFIEGEINATSGIFRGKVYATDGEFNGSINIGNGAIKLNKDGSGSLGNGALTWQADYGVMTIGTLQLGQVWGFNQLSVYANYNNDINASAALVFLDIPSKETVKLPLKPNNSRMYTIVNRTSYQKKINGNGAKIWWRSQVSLGNNNYSNKSEGDEYMLGAFATITLMFDGKWYIVAER